MRTPKTADFFALGRLMADMNIKDDIKEAYSNKSTKTAYDIGFGLIMSILEKATQKKAEGQIYSFLASTCEKTEEELQNPDIFLDCLDEIFKSEEWRGLFTKVARWITSE